MGTAPLLIGLSGYLVARLTGTAGVSCRMRLNDCRAGWVGWGPHVRRDEITLAGRVGMEVSLSDKGVPGWCGPILDSDLAGCR